MRAYLLKRRALQLDSIHYFTFDMQCMHMLIMQSTKCQWKAAVGHRPAHHVYNLFSLFYYFSPISDLMSNWNSMQRTNRRTFRLNDSHYGRHKWQLCQYILQYWRVDSNNMAFSCWCIWPHGISFCMYFKWWRQRRNSIRKGFGLKMLNVCTIYYDYDYLRRTKENEPIIKSGAQRIRLKLYQWNVERDIARCICASGESWRTLNGILTSIRVKCEYKNAHKQWSE